MMLPSAIALALTFLPIVTIAVPFDRYRPSDSSYPPSHEPHYEWQQGSQQGQHSTDESNVNQSLPPAHNVWEQYQSQNNFYVHNPVPVSYCDPSTGLSHTYQNQPYYQLPMQDPLSVHRMIPSIDAGIGSNEAQASSNQNEDSQNNPDSPHFHPSSTSLSAASRRRNKNRRQNKHTGGRLGVPDHQKERADLGYMIIYLSDDEPAPPPSPPQQQQHDADADADADADGSEGGGEKLEKGSESESESDHGGIDPFVDGHYGLEVPPHKSVFKKINLYGHNPDNYLASLKRLNKLSRAQYRNPNRHAKQIEELTQNARALGWMTAGRFYHPEWDEEEQMYRSPAVHAVYASKKLEIDGEHRKKDVLLFPKKEQNRMKFLIRKKQQKRESKYHRVGVDWSGHLSHHTDLNDLDNDFQERYDEEEQEQHDDYYNQFIDGKLPRLHRDKITGFRLTKSREKQQLTRLYSTKQIQNAKDAMERQRMRQDNREKKNIGIFKVMDEAESSSDQEYQPPRTRVRHPHHFDATKGYPSTGFRFLPCHPSVRVQEDDKSSSDE